MQDVLVGEVCVGFGQSNVDGRVRGFAANDEGLQKIAAGAPARPRHIDKGGKGWQLAASRRRPEFFPLLFTLACSCRPNSMCPWASCSARSGRTR